MSMIKAAEVAALELNLHKKNSGGTKQFSNPCYGKLCRLG